MRSYKVLGGLYTSDTTPTMVFVLFLKASQVRSTNYCRDFSSHAKLTQGTVGTRSMQRQQDACCVLIAKFYRGVWSYPVWLGPGLPAGFLVFAQSWFTSVMTWTPQAKVVTEIWFCSFLLPESKGLNLEPGIFSFLFSILCWPVSWPEHHRLKWSQKNQQQKYQSRIVLKI